MRSRHFAPTGNALGFDDAFRLLHVSSGRVLAIEPDGAAGGGGGGGSRRGGGRISRSSLRMSGAPPSVAGLDPEVPATKPVSLTTSYDPAPRQVEWRGGTVAATAAPPGERRPRRPRRAPRPPSFVHTRRARSSWWSLSTRCATWGDSSSSTVTSSSGTGPPAATSTSSRSVRPTPSGTLALAPSCTPALASSDAIDPPPPPCQEAPERGSQERRRPSGKTSFSKDPAPRMIPEEEEAEEEGNPTELTRGPSVEDTGAPPLLGAGSSPRLGDSSGSLLGADDGSPSKLLSRRSSENMLSPRGGRADSVGGDDPTLREIVGSRVKFDEDVFGLQLVQAATPRRTAPPDAPRPRARSNRRSRPLLRVRPRLSCPLLLAAPRLTPYLTAPRPLDRRTPSAISSTPRAARRLCASWSRSSTRRRAAAASLGSTTVRRAACSRS